MNTKKQSARNKIVTAAWKLFYEKGFQGTTVDDIIELSGTSKGTFYYYFKAKDELLDTLAVILDDFYEALDEKMDPEMNSFNKLLFLNYEAHRMMEERISIDLVTSLYAAQLNAQGEKQLLNHNRRYYRLVTRIVEEGQKRGEILDDAPATDIVRYFAMCERALVSDWCLNQGAYSLSEFSKRCMKIMLAHYKG